MFRIIDNNKTSNQNMWGIKESIYKRQFNALRSAQQKYARRCNWEKMMQVSLEMAASGCSRAAYDYLSTLMVEDKFPAGAELLHNHQYVLKQWKKMSPTSQMNEIAQMCYNITHTKSDRHPAYLARVAMKMVADEMNGKESTIQHDQEELQVAKEVEKVILRLPKKNELPTPEDFQYTKGISKLYGLIFTTLPANRTNLLLFNYFKDNWIKQAKSTARLYIYNLVGRMFHKHGGKYEFPVVNAPPLKMIELDDYVYDKHTVEGKKRKRGLQHFLEVGAKIENPSEGILTRGGIKRKAEKIYLESEKDYGTRNANSRFERKRLRATFNDLKSIKGEKIDGIVACQKPCGSKPKTQYVHTTAGNTYFVKGPYKDTCAIEFQYELDDRKDDYGIMKMNINIVKEGDLYYLMCPKKEGFENMSSSKLYNDAVLWNLIKVLIFRSAFNVSDTNLRNVMYNAETNEVLSVDEMTPNRMKPRGQRLVDHLFNKPPKKMFCDMIMGVVERKREEFIEEVKKYGTKTRHLIN